MRAREQDYVQYGKPAEITVEHVEFPLDAEGKRTEVRYIEKVKGVTSAPEREHHGRDTGDLHSGTCKGRTGVVRLWERDGRLWCAGCYSMRYGVAPPPDLELKVVKKNQARASQKPETQLNKLMRRGPRL